jgi:hypothetical protein
MNLNDSLAVVATLIPINLPVIKLGQNHNFWMSEYIWANFSKLQE